MGLRTTPSTVKQFPSSDSDLRESLCTLDWLLIKNMLFSNLRNTVLAKHLLFLSDPSPIIGYACHSLTHSLPFSKTWLMWPWHVKMATQNLLKLLLLWKGCWGCYCCLMLMLRNVLTIVWCRFGSWSLDIKSNFCPDFEHNVWSWNWSWSSGEI